MSADEPRVGHALPRAEEAVIDPDKLIRYALDPTSPDGRHKARVFQRALGIEKRHWRYLRDAIQAALPHHPVSAVRPPRRPLQRTTWEVRMPVRGLNNRVLLVSSAWEMVAGRPELKSLRVLDKRKQGAARGTTL